MSVADLTVTAIAERHVAAAATGATDDCFGGVEFQDVRSLVSALVAAIAEGAVLAEPTGAQRVGSCVQCKDGWLVARLRHGGVALAS